MIPLFDSHNLVAALAVICTDRGQHKRIRLATVDGWVNRIDGTDLLHMPREGRTFNSPARNPHGAPFPYEFRCPICHRVLQVKADRWLRVVESVWRAGLDGLDVSYLD